MTSGQRHLRSLVEEATARAVAPPVAQLARRVRRRRRRRITGASLAVLVVTALGIGLGRPDAGQPPVPPTASRAPGAAGLSVSLESVPAGGMIRLSGTWCDPRTAVTLTLGARPPLIELGQVRADVGGSFTAQLRIPATAPPGPTIVTASCRAPDPAGKLAQSAPLTVLPG